ncbi:hypothetical protein [Sulfurovum sp.]|uniref:hypothetical protein n=1 Tax=Sulfurovum sp. TaxID=1969726 RepID=UPI0035631C5A
MNPLESITKNIQQRIDEKFADTNYIESYVAFLDILGMKNILNKDYHEVRSIFNIIEASTELYKNIGLSTGERFISQNQIKLLVMSDSIVISTAKETDRSLSKLIGISSYVIKTLLSELKEPVFIRGAIAGGNLYQDDTTVFGPALSEAYLLETNEAKNMRCVVSKSLHEDENFKNYVENNKTITKDNDGFYFIDFIDVKNRVSLIEYSKNILASDIDDKTKSKYSWLIEYLTCANV